MKLAVITPCLAPDRSFIHLLDASATRMGIPLIPHGVGQVFTGWCNMLIAHTVPEMIRLADEYSHVLYVDGRDSVFVGGQDEIEEKYRVAGSPPCFMGSDYQWPSTQEGVRINAGGYIAEIKYMVGVWTRLASRHSSGDYQQWILNEWPVDGIVCDQSCSVFQSVEGELLTMTQRVVNQGSGELPCVLHFRGGYCDPTTGREERIRPVLEQLYGGEV